MTPPSVAVVTTFYRPVLGGAEAAGERLATFLQRRGHRVVVLTKRVSMEHPETETIDGVVVERLRPVGERTDKGKWRVCLDRTRAPSSVGANVKFRDRLLIKGLPELVWVK